MLSTMVARMQRTHDRRRASFFVGPPGIGKSTAVAAFKAANPDGVMVTRINKRGVTGPQALQSMLLALRQLSGRETRYVTNATSEVQRYIAIEIQNAAGHLGKHSLPATYPKLTIVFDEAQRLTNGAIDALRDWNEPHGFCAGHFPIGLIFVGNNELSLEAKGSGMSILDEGMQDRLLYRERFSYDDVEREDVERFVRAWGITDEGAIDAIGSAFGSQNAQRSFRRLADFLDEVRDQSGGNPVTREVVRTVLTFA
ncbi:AAA family ATPase [Sphingomonas floccifaciens]|uniref:AAA family ATPase n=1 Tax=Sphingomonas floccifaciens TaxID=1844115 RepID=UPI0036D2BC98